MNKNEEIITFHSILQHVRLPLAAVLQKGAAAVRKREQGPFPADSGPNMRRVAGRLQRGPLVGELEQPDQAEPGGRAQAPDHRLHEENADVTAVNLAESAEGKKSLRGPDPDPDG